MQAKDAAQPAVVSVVPPRMVILPPNVLMLAVDTVDLNPPPPVLSTSE